MAESPTKSLADHLGLSLPKPPAPALDKPTTPKAFCQQILDSAEFRTYLLNGITLGDLPPAIILRLMDVAWGKPVERLETIDRSERLEDLTPARIAERLERVQTMLRLLQHSTQTSAAQTNNDGEPSSTSESDVGRFPSSVH